MNPLNIPSIEECLDFHSPKKNRNVRKKNKFTQNDSRINLRRVTLSIEMRDSRFLLSHRSWALNNLLTASLEHRILIKGPRVGMDSLTSLKLNEQSD